MKKQYVTVYIHSWIFVSCFVNRLTIRNSLQNMAWLVVILLVKRMGYLCRSLALLSHYCLYCGHRAVQQQLYGDNEVLTEKMKTHNMSTWEQKALVVIFPMGTSTSTSLLLCLNFCLFMREKEKINLRNFYYLVAILFQVIIFYWESNYNPFIHYLKIASYLVNIISITTLKFLKT